MDDKEIIDLYVRRDENAIKETDAKYGAYCTTVAINLLQVREDAQECVNDTYMAAWERIPPHIPGCLRAFLGRVTRNIAIGMYRRLHRKKRFDGFELIFSELEECVPSAATVDREVDTKLLGGSINNWLDTLPGQDRALFVRRYWFGDKNADLAKKAGMSEAGMSKKLARMRESLREYLSERGMEI